MTQPENILSQHISNKTQSNKVSTQKPQFDNFFELFDLPIHFDIDSTQLEHQMKVLQQRFHPDNSTVEPSHHQTIDSDDSADNLDTTDKTSALINHAYQILRYPDSRASYMLEMQGQDAKLNNSIADIDFLEDAMSLRIELDESQSLTELPKLTNQVNSLIQTYVTQFTHAYEQRQWQSAIDATQKLKFLVKLNKDISKKLDSLHQQNNDEDDLYV